MTKKFLCLAALAAAAAFASPLGAAAQRVGPVDDAPTAADGGAAKAEKKSDAARPAEGGAAKSEEDKSPVKQASGSPSPNGEAAHSARGEKAASPAPAQAAPTRQTNLPAAGSPPVNAPPAPPSYEAPAPIKADTTATSNPNAPEPAAPPPTSTYRPGAGDILDIRLIGSTSREPTLYTVLANGTVDYPLAGEPVQVVGLTTEEIGSRLSDALRRRGIFDRARFQVSVREYVSHTALVSGLVDRPGQKVLRREAVPLYVVLAESFPRPEAGRVVIISRATAQTKTLDLSDSNALNELVSSGDVINVQPRPREFFYIGGMIASAGQKDFTPGMTLTQAVLASGGVARDAGSKVRVAVARQGADGRLVTTEYDLREIEAGRVPDPRIQPGDRIEVGRRR